MAFFHAVPLALKLNTPDVFEEQIKPHLTDQFPQGGVTPLIVQLVILDFLQTCDECHVFMPALKKILKRPRVEKIEERKEPWLTIGHGDMWVNNIMVRFEDDTPTSVKFIDFQNFAYRSPAVDLFLFLWSSVQNSVLEEHFDDLLKLYHESFTEKLQELGCDTAPFPLENLVEEMKMAAKYGLSHALFMMTFVVFCKRGGFSVDQDSSSPPQLGTKEDITPEARAKVVFMVKKCHERGWLY
ncbi:hypothetical protein NQ317_012182 [Molorchus minor]|uniref:CHK kinase-like domain-containing protein n=1 Tax=Molorchus minor TaxID=1323400 RepID=A0ABQ9K4K6_9CUCU|nr:hypothetical protein NQ317_012182 [Molorchus minor]